MKRLLRNTAIALTIFPLMFSASTKLMVGENSNKDFSRAKTTVENNRPMLREDSLGSIHSKILDFGESHEEIKCRERFLEIMPILDSMGYKKIFFELLSPGYEDCILEYRETGEIPYPLLQDIYLAAKNTGEKDARITKNHLKDIFENAMRLGWEIKTGYCAYGSDIQDYIIHSDSVYSKALKNEDKVIFFGGQLHHIDGEDVAHIDLITDDMVSTIEKSTVELSKEIPDSVDDHFSRYLKRQTIIIDEIKDLDSGMYRLGMIKDYYIIKID